MPLFDGTLTFNADGTLDNLAQDGRLCVWTDGPQPEAEQEFVTRLVDRGVVSLVSSGPWSPRPRTARSVWWEDRISDRIAADDALRVPTLIRIDGGGPRDEESALVLSKLAKGPLTVVLTNRDQPDPFDDRAFLRESWGPAYQLDHVLRRL
jgi:hypothetical protein